MSDAYPEMMESVQRVARVVKDEEHRYATTFLVAEKVFHDELSSSAGNAVPGAVSFKLYDTFGLALDEQEDMARERGFEIDREGFETEMKQQRDRARASWKGADKGNIAPAYQQLSPRAARNSSATASWTPRRKSSACCSSRRPSTSCPPVRDAELVLDQTPFYAETGGQVGDHGACSTPHTGEKVATVIDTYPAVPGPHSP